MPRCPDCEAELGVEESALQKGQMVICPECGAEIVVQSVRPLKLELCPEDD